MKHRPVRQRLLVSVVVGLLCGPALAADGDFAVLEEIVVTAQKRAASLQDVPVAVSALSGARLDEAGLYRIEDLRSYVPSLFMTETALGNNISIRGVFSGVNPGFEQSVGTYVDGIYRGRPQQTRAPFLDLARVEVLRGPQSIVFGKNSVGGALNITTARPTADFEAAATALYEPRYDEREFDVTLSGPLSDRFRARLSARYHESDGHLRNLTLGERREPHREDKLARLWLEWLATDSLKVSFKAEHAEFDTTGRQWEIVDERPVPAGRPFAGLTYAQILRALGQDAGVLNTVADGRRSSNGDFSDNDADEFVLNVDWQLGDLTLTAISGYSRYAFDERCDCDFTGGTVFDVPLSERFDQFSQEIRLVSPTGGRIEYLVGAYFESADLSYRDGIRVPAGSVLVPLLNARSIPGLIPPGVLGNAIARTSAPRLFEQDAQSYAGFAQVTWNLGEDFRATLGLRYTHEDKRAARSFEFRDFDGNTLPAEQATLTPLVYSTVFNARAHTLGGRRSESKLLPSLILQYDLTDDVMGYLSVIRGAKSGGFDARSNNPTAPPATACATPGTPPGCVPPAGVGSFEFDDERATNVELGVKANLGGHAELNVAAYYTDFRDLQVSTFDGTLGFNVRNAGRARITGLEIDARWRATRNLTFTGSMALTDFEFREYFGQCAFGRTPDAPDGVNCDYTGKSNEFVADWVATLGAEYSRAVGDGFRFRAGADLYYTTRFFVAPTLDERQVQGAFAKLNARLALGADSGRWEVALLGKNLTGRRILSYGNDTPLAGSIFGAFSAWRSTEPGRTVAVQGSLRF
jgi:iron complex outermembrane receptor protein